MVSEDARNGPDGACFTPTTSICLQVEDDLDRIKNASSQQELMNSFKDFGRSLMDLNDTAGRRQGVSGKTFQLFWLLKNDAVHVVFLHEGLCL